ncbi:uncharacterized protein LOC111691852 [Anoplophora glabripennis]|uniref:uncharacterized protein LOC111691852 n=1 Tax=Anoplophora glabripennis TaxID=217634 RepID=UPI000C775AD3|nr:uncharacterized protein LOC111691852 [Anoplophora glabripennis]
MVTGSQELDGKSVLGERLRERTGDSAGDAKCLIDKSGFGRDSKSGGINKLPGSRRRRVPWRRAGAQAVTGHIVQNCTSKGCKHCEKKHNSLLHVDKPEQVPKGTLNAGSSQSGVELADTNCKTQGINSDTTSLTANVKVHSEILLSTALVLIKDKFGKSHECRALLDSGSQSNFLTKELCDRLQLSVRKTNVPVAGNINLADTTFNKSGKIDILLGATIFWDLLCVGQIRLGKGLPIIQKTKLGWIISGTVPPTQSSLTKQTRICNLSVEQNDNLNLQDQLEKFWRIENVQNHHILSKEERVCEDIFVKTTEQNGDGRFIVNLPIRDNLEELGNSYSRALKRFNNLENRLASNEEFGKQYRDFMKEYEDLGHMTKIKDHLTNETHKVVYYLPHHGVLRESSQTTKLRVVFDGSAETDTGVSLNHKLMVGPKIQDDLFDILIRFRKYNSVIAADVAKMYHQVLIKEEHRDLQRIFWRPSINGHQSGMDGARSLVSLA